MSAVLACGLIGACDARRVEESDSSPSKATALTAETGKPQESETHFTPDPERAALRAPTIEDLLRADTLAVLGEIPEHTRYAAARLPRTPSGNEFHIAYVSGSHLCGTGGCSLLLIETTAGGYRLVSSTGTTRPPIRVLETSTKGLPDLAVWSAGGGDLVGHEAWLKSDGVAYPFGAGGVDETTTPDAPGRVLISEDDLRPLR